MVFGCPVLSHGTPCMHGLSHSKYPRYSTLCDMDATLRSTAAGEQFLRQFDFSDAALAASLIDSLILVTHDEFHAGLYAELDSLVAESDRPLALFSVREASHTPYFDETDRVSCPSAVADGGNVGSEGPMANLLRDFSRHRGSGKVLDHPHINRMRAAKVRRLVVVDDIIGSGCRITRFIRWLSRDLTIKSWLSYEYVRFVAVAFAATDSGTQIVQDVKTVAAVRSNRIAEKGRAVWTERERERYINLCRRYAPRTSRQYWPLGFEEAMTMLVFQHKCPNTTPAIIWAGSKDWHALIDGRPEFSFEEWPRNPCEAEKFQQALRFLGQPTLSGLEWMRFVSPRAGLRLLLLAAISKRRLQIDTLSAVAGVSRAECEQLLWECHSFGWITTESRITERGLAELRHARELRLVPDETVTLTEEIYVPQSFRGASG